jgi:hypothetical protein
MKLSLSVGERINLSGITPKEGNITTQTIVRDILKKIELTQEEHKKVELKVVTVGAGQAYQWNNSKDFEIKVDFTEAETNVLKEAVEKLDREEKIIGSNLDLCLKILERK